MTAPSPTDSPGQVGAQFRRAVLDYWAQHPDFAAEARAAGLDTAAGHLPLRAVLFDMDGVLFDSMPGHARSWAQVAREFGYHFTEEEVYLNEGRTARTTMEWIVQRQFGRSATPDEVEQVYSRKCAVFNALPEAPKMPGADAVLAQLRTGGREAVVVTGSGQASLLSRLTTHYPGCFPPDRVVTGHDVQHGKPHPEPYLMGLKRAGGLRPWEALVVENAPLGTRAGVAAGVFTLVVNTGPLAPQVFAEEGANFLLPSMPALAESWRALTGD